MSDPNVHLPDEGLWEAVEDGLAAAEQGHLETCASCQARVAEVRQVLGWARDVSVPEPSPLFWQSFRRGVSRRIEQRERWTMVTRLAVAGAIAATLILALRIQAPVPSVPAAADRLPAWTALPAADDDVGLAMLDAIEAWSADLPLAGGSVEASVIALSDEEGAQLAEAVQREFRTGEEAL